MSIIYDALQKTQRNRAGIRDLYQERMSKRMQIVDKAIYVVIGALFIVTLYAYLPRVIKHFAIPKPVVQAVVVKKDPVELPPSLTLNGVMLDDQNSIAMINSQSYHLGDNVNGMKLVSIQLNSVKLQKGQEYMILGTMS